MLADALPLPMADIGDRPNQQPQSARNLTAEELVILQYFIQGEKRSMSNATLRLDCSDNSVRLSDAEGKVLGITKQMNQWQRKVLVVQKSKYTAAIKQLLFDGHYIATQRSLHPDFDEYHHYRLPNGYKLNYTEALQLWKVWWNSKRYQLHSQDLQLDVLVFNQKNWYPILDLRPNQGNFSLKTSIGEMVIPANDRVAWIDRAKATESQTATSDRALATPITPEPPPATPPSVSESNIPTEIMPAPPAPSPVEQPANDLDREIAELENFFSNLDAHDHEDLDAIENVDRIDELLSEQLLTDDPAIEELFSPPTPTEPVVVARSGQLTSEFITSNPLDRAEPKPTTAPTPTVTPAETLTVSQRKDNLKRNALRVLVDRLKRGEQITTTEVVKNNQGEIMNQKTTAIQRGCPSWAVELAKLTAKSSPSKAVK
jgi:hypothetical protein